MEKGVRAAGEKRGAEAFCAGVRKGLVCQSRAKQRKRISSESRDKSKVETGGLKAQRFSHNLCFVIYRRTNIISALAKRDGPYFDFECRLLKD